MQAHTYTPHAWFGEGSTAGGRTAAFLSKSHRFPSPTTIILPVCHCLPGILEIVMGRWMFFVCQKEGKRVFFFLFNYLDVLLSSLSTACATEPNLISPSSVYPVYDSWNLILKYIIGVRRWSPFQGLEHGSWQNVCADLLCQCDTGSPFPSWWIQVHPCSVEYL